MTSRTAADLLSEMILQRADFQSAYGGLERTVAESFLSGEVSQTLNPVDAKHMLRQTV